MNIFFRLSFLSMALIAISTFANARPGNPVRRGAPIGNSQVIPLDSILAHPERFSGKTVTINGVVQQNCTRKGCWMEIASAKGKPSVRITFKDYAFFVPLDSKGMSATAEGNVIITTLSKADVDHLTGEGAKLTRNADGTATEIGFEAAGVELRK
ncbi:MAG: DUF4920 domain-containing protein [Bacteroidota bacterium]